MTHVDRFSTIKEDVPSCTLIAIISPEQGGEIRTLQCESSQCDFPKNPLVNKRKV